MRPRGRNCAVTEIAPHTHTSIHPFVPRSRVQLLFPTKKFSDWSETQNSFFPLSILAVHELQ